MSWQYKWKLTIIPVFPSKFYLKCRTYSLLVELGPLYFLFFFNWSKKRPPTWYWYWYCLRILFWIAVIVRININIGKIIPVALRISTCKIQEHDQIKWCGIKNLVQNPSCRTTQVKNEKGLTYSKKCEGVIFRTIMKHGKHMFH